MSDSSSSGTSVLLPIALLSATLAVLLVTQTFNTFRARTQLRDTKAQMVEAYAQREPMVKQSAAVQKQLQDLVLDLLLLAKTDPEAKAIVDKFGIQQQAAAGAAPGTPAPAATPAP